MTTPVLRRNDCVVDFDHHGPAFAADPAGELRRARELCPVAWSAAHGGFWLVSGYEEAFEILRDDDTYSSADGVSVPPMKKKGPPIDVDPPLHRGYREALLKHFSRRSLQSLTADVEAWAVEAVEAVLPSGRADVVADIAAPVPARAIMQLLGLPEANWPRYARVWHDVFAAPQDPAVYEDLETVRAELRDTVRVRAVPGCPVHDVVTGLADAPFLDRVAAESGPDFSRNEEITEVGMTLLGAGLDTTTNMFAGTAVWLAAHPVERAALRDGEIPFGLAVEEFFRYFSTAPALARTVTRPVTFRGHDFAAGDRVLISFMGANRDPRAFTDPDRVDLKRFPNRHMAFGVGIHRCLGSDLARLVFPIMLRALLDRIPDFALAGDPQPYADCAQVTGWTTVPITFARAQHTQ